MKDGCVCKLHTLIHSYDGFRWLFGVHVSAFAIIQYVYALLDGADTITVDPCLDSTYTGSYSAPACYHRTSW